ncbi:MAG: hypothetical protein ACRCSI_04295 [Eubacterium aggregans]
MNALFTRTCCFFLTILPLCSMAEQNLLIGTWQSDHEKTMDFIRNNAKITDKQYEFSNQIFGKMKMIFTEDQICFWMPDWQFDGKAMKGWQDTEWQTYTLVGVNEDTAIISAYDPLKEKPGFILYSFEGPDTMWMYTGHNVTLHAREYFKRIPTPAIIPCKTPDATPEAGSDINPKR